MNKTIIRACVLGAALLSTVSCRTTSGSTDSVIKGADGVRADASVMAPVIGTHTIRSIQCYEGNRLSTCDDAILRITSVAIDDRPNERGVDLRYITQDGQDKVNQFRVRMNLNEGASTDYYFLRTNDGKRFGYTQKDSTNAEGRPVEGVEVSWMFDEVDGGYSLTQHLVSYNTTRKFSMSASIVMILAPAQ